MKRLFARTVKPRDPPPTGAPGSAAIPSSVTSHGGASLPSLQPQFTLPPLPHPHPYDHIALLATSQGLFLRPHVPTVPSDTNSTYVRIAWGLKGKVEEMKDEDVDGKIDWEKGVVVYGVVGVLNLFSASHLLVITSVKQLGYLFHESRPVFGVKSVTSIPLEEERARIVLNTLASKNAVNGRPSLIPSTPTTPFDISQITTDDSVSETDGEDDDRNTRVKFADADQVKIVSPIATTFPTVHAHGSSASLDSSGRSSPTEPLPDADAEVMSPMSPVAKALAGRLSFWTRLSKRTSLTMSSPTVETSDVAGVLEEPGTLGNSPAGSKIRANGTAEGHEGEKVPEEVINGILDATAPPPATTEERHSELEEKVVKECIREFTKGDMFFAYTFDITRSLQHKQEQIARSRRENQLVHDLTGKPKEDDADAAAQLQHSMIDEHDHKVDVLSEPQPMLPLWRRVDRKFWWNEWLAQPFVQAGLHPYVLPIMQGFYQIASFHIPRAPEEEEAGEPALVDYIIVSRRSRDRAGLRYQRRGVDEDAHTANFVETETIVRLEREGRANVFAYVQIRGSIPLYWSQSGYSLKPAPQISSDRNHAQNLEAFKRHFATTVPRYGPHTIVNLAEQHGKEAAVTHAYKEYAEELADKNVTYCEYDFHAETKGMKYENISKLLDKMERVFDTQGFFWISDNLLMSTQKGVFRVNCIDCLDRTNVVQSAFARNVLHRLLGAVGLFNQQTVERTEVDIVFNDVWANNGDAISRAYAGTSALKGDFTRTGKRDLGGMLNDGMNSLARMYTSTFSDWFCQAVIDYMLGYRTLSVFSEFLLKLQSTDPRDIIRLSKVRAEAIGTSVSRVLPEGERLLHGWTLFSPAELNRRVADKFEEKVLLLTAKALYVVSYDYNLEKVNMYVRVPLGDIHGIKKGAYIISPLEEASRDPIQNAGFIVSYSTHAQTTRFTSYSIRNSLEGSAKPPTRPQAFSVAQKRISDFGAGIGQMSAPALKQGQQIFAKTGAVFARMLPPASQTQAQAPPSTSTRSPPPSPTPSSLSHASPRRPSSPAAPMSGSTKSKAGGVAGLRPLMLSRTLSNAAAPVATEDPVGFVAFKALPVDPARMRRESGSFADGGDDQMGAATSKEAVDIMVDAVHRACEDLGNVREGFVVEEDVVSLADAQRMTTVYAKMEYGVKRLLWLGGG